MALPGATVQRLDDWYAEAVVAGGADAAGDVWPGKDGGPMHDRSVHRALHRAAHRAGLEVTRPGGRIPRAPVTLRGLRRTGTVVSPSSAMPTPASPRPFTRTW